jgi:hypothetical protein
MYKDHVLNNLNQWFAILWILNSEALVELTLDSINISLGKWTLTLSSKVDLHNIANKLPKYFHRLYRCYKVSPSWKVPERVEYTTHPHSLFWEFLCGGNFVRTVTSEGSQWEILEEVSSKCLARCLMRYGRFKAKIALRPKMAGEVSHRP